jgi:hypothetical protein
LVAVPICVSGPSLEGRDQIGKRADHVWPRGEQLVAGQVGGNIHGIAYLHGVDAAVSHVSVGVRDLSPRSRGHGSEHRVIGADHDSCRCRVCSNRQLAVQH